MNPESRLQYWPETQLHPQAREDRSIDEAREDQSIDGEMGATTEPIDPAGQEEVQNEG